MSAKLMYSLTDDKKGVKSQMGCMNGLFQLFDRHHFMGGRRIRLPPPGECQQTEVENASCKAKAHMKDTSKSMLQGDNLRHDPKDRHGISSDSISSSTCSSVFTSNKSAIQQTTSTTPSISQEAPSRTILHTQSAESPNLNQPSGIVKENGNREVPGLTVKTPAVKGIRCAVKLIDSPRPSAPSAPITPKFTGLDESFKKLRKFQDIRSGHSEGPLITRNEVHRFSCDGRVTHSQDTLKSALKLKEKPRLSLDSRASSARMFTPKSEAHCSPKRSEKDNLMSPKVEQEAESCKHTSIVAKLMGLENTSGFRFRGNSNESSEPSNADKNTPQILPFSFKDSTANYGTAMKPISNSRKLVEPAPWKQVDAGRGLQKSGFGEAIKKDTSLMPSVYGEIEKRVAELEFKKSSRDLRALEQILGAMQKSKDNLQMKKDHASDSLSQSSNSSTTCSTHHQELRSADSPVASGNNSRPITNGREGHQNTRALPIVVTKPVNAGRSQHHKTSAESITEGFSGLRKLRTPPDVGGQCKDLDDKYASSDRTPTNRLRDSSSPTLLIDKKNIASPRAARIKTSRVTQHLVVENKRERSSLVASPTLQQRQLKFDKKLQQSSPPSEPIRTKRQPTDADSPVKRIQVRASSLQKHGDKLSKVRINTCPSILGDYSLRSDSNINQSSHLDAQVTSKPHPDEKIDIRQDNKSTRLGKCRAMAELNIITPEQPSPVSVLDAMFCSDESPSPVKKISNAFIGDESYNAEEQGWSVKHEMCDSTRSFPGIDNDPGRLHNGEQLFEEEADLYSTTFGDLADYGLPSCEGEDQDRGYIFEILLASGFLQEVGSGLKNTQPHPSGQAMKPEIFKSLEIKNAKRNFALNKHNSSTVSMQSMLIEKTQRKLIFDVVNEILGRKSVESSYSELSPLSSKVADINQAKQKILKDLHLKIDQLQVTQCNSSYGNDYEEVLRTLLLKDMQHGISGSEFQSEIYGLVLDVERLIFKDLISEIIGDASKGPRTRYTGHCRQLFSK